MSTQTFSKRVDLTKYLKGRLRFLLFVTGPTGAGKSTIISHLENEKMLFGVYPGRTVRRNRELMQKVLDADNSTAVPELEEYIRKYTKSRLYELTHGLPMSSAAVDGIPRSLDQIKFARKLALGMDKSCVFLVVEASAHERLSRLAKRGDPTDVTRKRMDSDSRELGVVVRKLERMAKKPCVELLIYYTGGTPNELNT